MSNKAKSLFLIGILGVGLLTAGYTRYSDVYFKIKKNFSIFSEAYQQVVLRYVDEVDPGELMDVALSAMLDSLDPYTTIVDKAKSKKLDVMTSGRYGGVGLEVGVKGEKIVVVAPMEGYSAYRKGVKSGDVIQSVNDIPTKELSPDEIQNLMRGDPGTTVNITVQRYGVDEPLTFELKREYIEVRNVAFADIIGPEQNVGYILINRFSKNTAEEVRKAILSFREESELQGLILDVRNNPGGLLGEAVKTVDKFVKPGVKVVETKGRVTDQNHVYRSEEPAMLNELPLMVLQNEGSASASEVVAGALQDLDRAVIVGKKSFGKGLVQVVRSLPYDMALKMTASKYYTPSGRSIQSVDYSTRDTVGQQNEPDSAGKAFETRAGRTVYDSEGIIPDINIKDTQQSLLEIALQKNSHFFFFANQYASEHDTLDRQDMNDALYKKFRSYLKSQDFQYKTRTQKEYEDLKHKLISDTDTVSAEVRSALDRLEQKIETRKQQLFEQHKQEIKEDLYLELVSRYRGKNGRIREAIRFDPYIQDALQILGQPKEYRSILSLKQ